MDVTEYSKLYASFCVVYVITSLQISSNIKKKTGILVVRCILYAWYIHMAWKGNNFKFSIWCNKIQLNFIYSLLLSRFIRFPCCVSRGRALSLLISRSPVPFLFLKFVISFLRFSQSNSISGCVRLTQISKNIFKYHVSWAHFVCVRFTFLCNLCCISNIYMFICEVRNVG